MLSFSGSTAGRHLRAKAALLLSAVAIVGSATGAAHANDNTLRLLTLNIWNKFKNQPEIAAQFLSKGDYDVLMFQEESGSRYVTHLPGIFAEAGLGTYQGARNGSSGILSRLDGTVGTYRLPGVSTQGNNLTLAKINAGGGRPETTVGSVHFDWADQSNNRVREAKALSTWARNSTGPVIIGGDYNAGDTSERGLHSVSQQEMLLRIYAASPNNSFYYSLLQQYATDKTVLDGYISANRGKSRAAINAAPVPAGLFKPETSPIRDNTPVTMNVLKKDFMMMQTDSIREGFEPHELGGGSATWPSVGEDHTGTWGSWHRVKIDHFMASRPFGKWFQITDDANDPYLGVIDNVNVTRPDGNQTPLSDHEPVAHEFTWVGPKLETFKQDGKDATRLVWGEGAARFEESGKVFELTRNNMRTDVYLGQISDANGIPTLGWLTDAEKKTLLDCGTSDSRLAGAVAEYCIDDHSFIAETLVSDGATVVVTEDAALGNASADLRLTEGAGLRIAGTDMAELGRNVSLEGQGGFIDVSAAAAKVTASGVFSGNGGLTKQGAGTLRLTAENSYTGATTVQAGTLLVNGDTAASSLTTVLAGSTLGGNGRVGDLMVAKSGTITPGDFGYGAFMVDGDLTIDGGFLNFDFGADGFDVLNVTGDFTALSEFTISFSWLDDFLPTTDMSFEFLNIAGDFGDALDLATLLLPQDPRFLNASIFGNGAGSYSLAWADPYAIAAVPLPAPALMLLSGLGLLFARSRRKSAAAAA